jgi:hypothetical protein
VDDGGPDGEAHWAADGCASRNANGADCAVHDLPGAFSRQGKTVRPDKRSGAYCRPPFAPRTCAPPVGPSRSAFEKAGYGS